MEGFSCAAFNRSHSRGMFREYIRGSLTLLLAAGAVAISHGAEPDKAPLPSFYGQATVAPAKTSIYIGNVKLTMPPFVRSGIAYASTYEAKVFPFFFYNESGRISINITDEDLLKLAAGERVYFDGEAFDTNEEPRKIEGHADPDDERSGKIKVRVWVSKNIELIFNTTYAFDG